MTQNLQISRQAKLQDHPHLFESLFIKKQQEQCETTINFKNYEPNPQNTESYIRESLLFQHFKLKKFDQWTSQPSEKINEGLNDRFIPIRKLLNKQILSKEDDKQNKIEYKQVSQLKDIGELYKMSVLNSENGQKNWFQCYKNNNQLKYKNIKSTISSDCFKKYSNNLINFQPKSIRRKINKTVFKVLDAPTLYDDYFLNLLDWSSQNLMAVALSSNLYLWNATTANVAKLCQIPSIITSINWSKDGKYLAIGGQGGQIDVWDANALKKVRIMQGHSDRVSSISWNSNNFSTGSKDKTILHRDMRSPFDFVSKIKVHKQQVCGLKWSDDSQYLCSGGSDNKMFVFSSQSNLPVWNFNDHISAVKAIAWSPHQHGLLASGGATADRTIIFRNILTGQCVNKINTNSHICNMIFSKTVNELVTTHGYNSNDIKIWDCVTLENIATLTGHSTRVLYLTMSPDASTIVSGAGDQTLRFWNVFPSISDSNYDIPGNLQPSMMSLR